MKVRLGSQLTNISAHPFADDPKWLQKTDLEVTFLGKHS